MRMVSAFPTCGSQDRSTAEMGHFDYLPAGMPEYGLHTAAKQCTRYPARRKARNLVRTALSTGDAASSATGGRNRELAHLSDFGQESSPHVNVVGAAPAGTEFGRGSGELRMLGVFVLSCRDA